MPKLQLSVVPVGLAAVAMLLNGCGNPVTHSKNALVKKFITPQAIKGFIQLKDENGNNQYLDEYCSAKFGFDISSLPEKIWWPGCGLMSKMDDFSAKCAKDGCVDAAVMKAMNDFNDKHGGELVKYKSRAGKDSKGKDIEIIDLQGWWMPAPGDSKANPAPRIVVQHGFTSNSNKFRQMFVAYLLRNMGFSVLVNNLRDHCYSGDSKEGIIGWGHAYPLDTLGAWDHLVKEQGGGMDASKVGILGFSMGGFTTANAFGLEGKVPAAWIDGAPFTPRAGFEVGFVQAMKDMSKGVLSEEWIKKHVSEHVWADIEKEAAKQGVDLNEHLPAKELPSGPNTTRPVFVTANKKDGTVPYQSSVDLTDLLKKHPKKYDLKEFWSLDGACVNGDNEFNTAHCVDFMTHTAEYNDKLCAFWYDVFGLDAKKCKAHTMRLYAANVDDVAQVAPTTIPTFVMVAAVFATALTLVVVVARRVMKVNPAAEEVPEAVAAEEDGLE